MIRTFFDQRMSRNTEVFWFIAIIYAVLFQGYLGVNYYADFYYSLVGNEVVMWIGTIGSYIAAIIGVLLYGFFVIFKSDQACPFRWYDFVFSQLVGLIFVVLFGILLIGLTIAAIIAFAILVVTVIIKIVVIIGGG